MEDILNSLNPKQKEIVLMNQGALMVLAGAGSGKTKAITSKISYLLQEKKVPVQSILAVTFTNKAAKEMKERVLKIVDFPEWSLNISTFHSFCVGVLRKNPELLGLKRSFTIYDSSESLAVMKRILKNHDVDPRDFSPKEVLSYIDRLKNKGYYPGKEGDVEDLDLNHDFFQYYVEYERELSSSNALDFGSLIVRVLELFEKNPTILQLYQDRFKYILVDEYQDTNKSQFQLINLLAQRHIHLCVVGDLDQSIYSFRNAEVRNILLFEKIYSNCKIIKLEQNYRSTVNIVEAASAVISHNVHRKEKQLISLQDQGEKIKVIECFNQDVEASLIANSIFMIRNRGGNLDDVAIFYRNNAQSRKLEDALRQLRISYKIIGGMKFYERKEVKDLICYLRLLANPEDNASVLRVINTPSRGLGPGTIDKLLLESKSKGVSLWEQVRSPSIKLSPKVMKSLKEFSDVIVESSQKIKRDSLASVFEYLFVMSGYKSKLESSTNYEDAARLDNLKELKSALMDYSSRENPLEEFLEESALASAEQEVDEGGRGVVQLMTIHASKGLEFDTVFVSGVEEGIFPSSRSLEEEDDIVGIEEERRLFYVAMTRARKDLYLTYTLSRIMYGSISQNPPSRFLFEIPQEYKIFQKRSL